MKIKIRFIGRYKEIIGNDELEIEINNADTIWDIVEMLIQKHPQIEKDKKFITVSKNKVFANLDTKIDDGDVVTITPPVVSGG